MEAVHGIHELPGLPVPHLDPARPAFEALPEYFATYERAFDLDVVRPVAVKAVRSMRGGSVREASMRGTSEGSPADLLVVETDRGAWIARALINATGTWRHPFVPYYPGVAEFRGRRLHTADYRGPAEFAGQHVVVVGGGTSAIHALAEIAEVAHDLGHPPAAGVPGRRVQCRGRTVGGRPGWRSGSERGCRRRAWWR